MGSCGAEPPPEPMGVTAQLSHWISGLQLSDVPPAVLERAKYQLLDGIACALVGAHVPWSEKYVEATAEYEPAGEYSVIGWDKVREMKPILSSRQWFLPRKSTPSEQPPFFPRLMTH